MKVFRFCEMFHEKFHIFDIRKLHLQTKGKYIMSEIYSFDPYTKL